MNAQRIEATHFIEVYKGVNVYTSSQLHIYSLTATLSLTAATGFKTIAIFKIKYHERSPLVVQP